MSLVRAIWGGLEPFTFDAGGVAGQEPAPALRRTTVASFNLSPEPGDVAGNLLLAERTVAEARREVSGLEWALLPELFTCAYAGLAEVERYAEDALEGPSARVFVALARDLGLRIAYGFPEKLPGGGVADSASLVGPEGVLLTYRKRHLVDTTAELRAFVPGAELPVSVTDGFGAALAICWDLGFPEVARDAALRGAHLVLAPAGWRDPWGPQYELSCSARALDNGIYLASANQIGAYPGANFGAPGGVYGPDGRRISEELRISEGILGVATLDLESLDRWRAYYGSTVPAAEDARSVPRQAC